MKNLAVIILVGGLLLTIGCAGPRYKAMIVGSEDKFVPQHPGQKAKVRVYDFEKESVVPIRNFKFKFEPKEWAEIRPLPGKKYMGELEVRTLYTHSINTIEYTITPVLKEEYDSEE